MEYLSIEQTAENGVFPSEEFRRFVLRNASLVLQRLILIGPFLLMRKNQMTKELKAENL